jgi:hypothetical protein
VIKANVSITRKKPGMEEYSSDMYHAGLEIELPDTVYTNGNGDLRESLTRMFREVEATVDAQIASKSPMKVTSVTQEAPQEGHETQGSSPLPARAPAVTQGPSKKPREGDPNTVSFPPASQKQIGFLISLAKRNKGMDPAAITRLVKNRTGKAKVYDLDVNEASRLIDEMKKAG